MSSPPLPHTNRSKDPATFPKQAGLKWVQTLFKDKSELIALFQGIDVVLNFIVVANDPNNEVAERLVDAAGLVDAAVEAGFKRFAPSEWAM